MTDRRYIFLGAGNLTERLGCFCYMCRALGPSPGTAKPNNNKLSVTYTITQETCGLRSSRQCMRTALAKRRLREEGRDLKPVWDLYAETLPKTLEMKEHSNLRLGRRYKVQSRAMQCSMHRRENTV